MNKSTTLFEKIKEIDHNKNEFWSARKLSITLGYLDFKSFIAVIQKAKESCETSGQETCDHFIETVETISIDSSTNRTMQSFRLSRYACKLIVQNSDPSKDLVAQGQAYFA